MLGTVFCSLLRMGRARNPTAARARRPARGPQMRLGRRFLDSTVSAPGGRVLFFKVYLFTYLFERDRDSANVKGAERERERDRIPSKLCTASTEPDGGLEPMKP